MNADTATQDGQERQAQRVAPSDRRMSSRERRNEGRRLPFVAAVLQRAVGLAVPLLGQAQNLGRGGMLLRRCRSEQEAEFPPGTLLWVSFELPDEGGLLTLQAEVVFEQVQDRGHFSAGLRFCDPSPAQQIRLDRYVDL